MEQKRGSRLTPAGKTAIGKITSWGRKHPKYRKQVIAVLIIVLLGCYLTAFLKTLLQTARSKWILAGITGICVLLLLLPRFVYGSDAVRYEKTLEKLHRIMEEEAFEESAEETKEEPVRNKPPFDYDIAALQKVNADCIGWLGIAGTRIDYPVMQRAGNENYYLEKDFFTEKNKNGCLILDEDSSISMNCDNLIIHGHNMRSGEMFGELEAYREEAYADEHNLIYFVTAEETREYLVMAAFYSKVFYEDEQAFKYYNFFALDTYVSFMDFYGNVKDMSLYDTGVEAAWGDKFITLSTCSYQEENGRFVVIGKLVQ